MSITAGESERARGRAPGAASGVSPSLPFGALWELLRGLQAADDASNARPLYASWRADPRSIYGGLLTVVLRLVFLLYAEEQGLMPDDPEYARRHAVGGLFERLCADAARDPGATDQRFGAYAQLLATFRAIFEGGDGLAASSPPRGGQLFDPEEYPFLEGRPPAAQGDRGGFVEAPRVSDGVILRVLEGLLVHDGERISYRELDVEHVGAVYESLMGFEVQALPGRSIAVRPKSVVIDVDALLAVAGPKRAAWLKKQADCELASGGARMLREATTADDVVAALGRRAAAHTPRLLPPGALFLQPSEERRRSGSHYTPRELSASIVSTALRPVLDALGPRPTPDQILAVTICDPAMGSGAFLVEACRQLAAALVAAWEAHPSAASSIASEDRVARARRLVARRCLYGVDKDRFAVGLARLSLWLTARAKDRAFTFVDHALKHGDSLVGLTKAQIAAFDWSAPSPFDAGPSAEDVMADMAAVTRWRRQIVAIDADADEGEQRRAFREAERAARGPRLVGDLCVAAYFGAENDKERERLRRERRALLGAWRAGGAPSEVERLVDALRGGERPVAPLHWEIELPEVFERANPGFDAIVGNPPFVWGNRISRFLGESYRDWLLRVHPGAHGNGDLVAHFLRRSYALTRSGGAAGLVTTNTIAEGDTLTTGLGYILASGGRVFAANRNWAWPGAANVRVSHVFVSSARAGPCVLDGRAVRAIGPDLREPASDWRPVALAERAGQSFKGLDFGGAGFLLRPSEAHEIMKAAPSESAFIWPVLNASDFTGSPTQTSGRAIINLMGLSLDEARRVAPRCLAVVEEKVRPARAQKKGREAERWWHYRRAGEACAAATRRLRRVLINPVVSKYISFAFASPRTVFTNTINVFAFEEYAAFSVHQSRAHEAWALRHGSSLRADPRYNPTDCFETFPFPPEWRGDPVVESAGQAYYDFRAALMARSGEGLTKTYNRFHDPSERSPEILRLRDLHAAMDRAVLSAYGWTDVHADCDFFLDDEMDRAPRVEKKRSYRYRWPDAVRDDVIRRLLDLNEARHRDELARGAPYVARRRAR